LIYGRTRPTVSRQLREGNQPGATPRVNYRGDRSSALKGRRGLAPLQDANCGLVRNPGRCPGLATVGAFSAGHREFVFK